MVVEPKDIKHKGKKAKNTREFYRLVERIRIDVQLLKADEKDEHAGKRELEKTGEPSEHYTMDISGGGLQFFSDVYCRENSYVDITLNFKTTHPTFDPVTVRAKILRTVQVENSQYFDICAEYADLDERNRTQIERYIFIRQREMIAEKRIGYL
jgi:c-di-GMP-binding flagellar brake protein YcgR